MTENQKINQLKRQEKLHKKEYLLMWFYATLSLLIIISQITYIIIMKNENLIDIRFKEIEIVSLILGMLFLISYCFYIHKYIKQLRIKNNLEYLILNDYESHKKVC